MKSQMCGRCGLFVLVLLMMGSRAMDKQSIEKDNSFQHACISLDQKINRLLEKIGIHIDESSIYHADEEYQLLGRMNAKVNALQRELHMPPVLRNDDSGSEKHNDLKHLEARVAAIQFAQK